MNIVTRFYKSVLRAFQKNERPHQTLDPAWSSWYADIRGQAAEDSALRLPTKAEFAEALIAEMKSRPDIPETQAHFYINIAVALDLNSLEALKLQSMHEMRYGFFDAAESTLGKVMGLAPGRADIAALSAEVSANKGDRNLAVARLESAIAIDPDSVDWRRQWINMQSNWKQAAAIVEESRRIAARFDDDWQINCGLGRMASRADLFEVAEAAFRRASVLAPERTEPYTGLADIMFLRQDPDEALALLERASEIAGGPIKPSKLYVPEEIDYSSEFLEHIESRIRAILSVIPDVSAVRHILACDLVLQSKLDAAKKIWWAMLVDSPEDKDASINFLLTASVGGPQADLEYDLDAVDVATWDLLRKVLEPLLVQRMERGRRDIDTTSAARRRLVDSLLESPTAGGLARLAERLKVVTSTDKHAGWACAYLLYVHGDQEGAREAYAMWVEAAALTADDDQKFKSDFEKVWALATFLEGRKQSQDAAAIFSMFLLPLQVLYGTMRSVYSLLAGRIATSEIFLRALFSQISRLEYLVGTQEFGRLHFQATLATAFLSDNDAEYDALCKIAVAHYSELESRHQKPCASLKHDERLRVAYVMADFDHVDMSPEQYAVTFHDLKKVEVTVYFFTPESASPSRPDRIGPPGLASWGGKLRNINSMTADQRASVVAADGIEILVDCVGWWASEIPELFVKRPAPVQVTWLGLGRPGKAGIMDYIIGNEVLFPREFDERYPEKFIRVSGSYIPPKPTSLSLPSIPRKWLGLPEDAFIYLGYHQLSKLTARTLRIWFEIMRRTSDSILILPSIKYEVVEHFAADFEVDVNRIYIFPWVRSETENTIRVGVGDLYLDTVPFNSAALTGYDAIAMNTPRLSLSGKSLYGRFGKIMSEALSLDDLVCETERDYIDLAVEFYENPARLEDVKKRMAAARFSARAMRPEPLMRQIEEALGRVSETYRNGLPPMGFDVPEL
jgi:predicted O-linked N-acetylglucosamine transferase (SPINDLY family)